MLIVSGKVKMWLSIVVSKKEDIESIREGMTNGTIKTFMDIYEGYPNLAVEPSYVNIEEISVDENDGNATFKVQDVQLF